jgi:hypothetical protein
MLRAPDGSRQVLGKVMIDLSTGKVWGFPTTVEQPYPVDVMKSQPPTSTPFLLENSISPYYHNVENNENSDVTRPS